MVRLRSGSRKGFSLVELVVVVLILGIIAAVAAPKMFSTATDARTNSTRQSLTVVRDAIELYNSQNSAYPTAATLATDLRPFLKGPFPSVQMGTNRNANVIVTTQPVITSIEAGGAGWIYNQSTGDISVNEVPYISW